MEAGYLEKVEELCERHSLEGFANLGGMLEFSLFLLYLHLGTLVLFLTLSREFHFDNS